MKYSMHGDWHHESTTMDHNCHIVTHCRDLVDESGRIFPDGAFRVTVTFNDGTSKRKTFRGETAHNDAQRYADDERWSYHWSKQSDRA